MSQQIINVGATANDGTGDTLRLSQQKANLNFTELYGSKLDSVVAGTNITVDNTDPLNPIISSTGGGGTGDMLKSVYDTDDDGIVDYVKRVLVPIINETLHQSVAQGVDINGEAKELMDRFNEWMDEKDKSGLN